MTGFLRRDLLWHPPALTPAYRSSVARAPRLPPLALPSTLSEETGPVFGHGEVAPGDADLLRNFGSGGEPQGERILLHGRVLDENGRAVPGTLVEIWQANAGGRYRHHADGHLAPLDPHFGGCGRAITGEDGSYAFLTIKPGPYPFRNGPNAWRPAHVHFSVMGLAFAQRMVTQMYFPGDPLLPHCAIVGGLRDPRAVQALTATFDLEAATPFERLAYRFDLVLRGRRATPFENRPEGT